MTKFYLTLTTVCLLALPVFGQSSLMPREGYEVATWLPEYPVVGAFDFADTLFYLHDGDTIHQLGIRGGEELKKYGKPETYPATSYASFLTLSPDGRTIWSGYTSNENLDDRIYSIDVESGEWTLEATFPANMDLVFWKDSILVSGLNNASWDTPAAIFVLDTTGTNQHRRIIETGGYSAGLAVDQEGNLYYGSSFASGSNVLYRWNYDVLQAEIETPTGLVLGMSHGEKLSDLPSGAYDCEVDEGGNVLFNMNLYGGIQAVCMWNGTAGDGANIDTLATASGEWDWLGTLKARGDLTLSGGPDNMLITYSVGQPLSMVSYSSKAQYIAEVLDYTPAPGQLVNVAPWGTPAGARSIEGGINGAVCLGAFGGSLVFRFENPVENDPHNPFGVDFTIFGNPLPEWAEPGVVWVMKDENGNGEADDAWYELAGSDYWFSSTLKQYQVTYSNPGGDVAADVPWTDQLGNSGVISANAVHTQPYYPLHNSFPGIDPDSYSLDGTLIGGLIFEHPSGMKSIRRAFGYADNLMRGTAPYTLPDNPYTRELENSGGDGFDIDWAVDAAGNYVDLERIHFVRVQNALQADGGWLGELSTEVTGAVDVEPDASVSGETDMVVIRDLPPQLEVGIYQMEVKLFQNGRLSVDGEITWSTSSPGATVDSNHLLTLTEEGPLTITAALINRPEIKATVTTLVQLKQTGVGDEYLKEEVLLYPNPATNYIRITGMEEAPLSFYDLSGKELRVIENYIPGSNIGIQDFSPGLYLLKIGGGPAAHWLKLVIQ
jgi:hypothetical protein